MLFKLIIAWLAGLSFYALPDVPTLLEMPLKKKAWLLTLIGLLIAIEAGTCVSIYDQIRAETQASSPAQVWSALEAIAERERLERAQK